MIPATVMAFYAAHAALVLAGFGAGIYFFHEDPRLLTTGRRLLLMGVCLEAAAFGLRWFTWRLLPLTTFGDTLLLMTLFCGVIVLIIGRNAQMESVLSFYLPAIALIALVNVFFGHGFIFQEPRSLSTTFLSIHVSLAFFAYALFFVASITSIAYMIQARYLKLRKTGSLFHRLPSLERLDTILYRLIWAGYPLFIVTVAMGSLWVAFDRELLGDRWWLSPKVLQTPIMLAFYAIAFHARQFGLLSGRKLASFVFFGFTLMLAAYLVLGILDLRNVNFWEHQA